MVHSDVIRFLLQIAVLLFGALLFGLIAKRIGLPPVVGELFGGIVLGPTVFGAVLPSLFTSLFPASSATEVGRDAISRIGLLLFLFLAGSEVELRHFRLRGRGVLWTSICGMVVPFALGWGLVRFFPDLWGNVAQGNTHFGLLIGTAMAISALPVIARILRDLNLLGTEFGFLVLTAGTADDLVGWTLFGVLLAPAGDGNFILSVARTVGVLATLVAIGHFIFRPVLRRVCSLTADPIIALSIVGIFVLLASVATEIIGVHAVVGAFLIGVVLKEEITGAGGIAESLSVPVLSLLAPIYFVSIGLKANFITHFDLLLTLAITLAACLGKVIGGGFGAWRSGLPKRTALAVGFGMNVRGAMEIILATVALEHHLIDERIFVSLVFMALFTTLVSGPLVRWLLRTEEKS